MEEYETLALANALRGRLWDPDGKLDASFHSNELGGETGEVQNIVKKLERERLGIKGSRATVDKLAEELADVVICVDKLATLYGIDLHEAIIAKFNVTSDVVGFPIKLDPHTESLI